jgi:RecB family exonuclease
MLRGARLRIAAVEQPIDVAWRGGRLAGRIDLLVVSEDGAIGIIDLKWGMAGYRKQLASGQALQLALYAFAHAVERDATVLPGAAYFSLKQGKLFGLASGVLPNVQIVSGPSLSDTWARVERSLDPAERAIQARRFAATGLRRSLPLLTTLGVSETEHAAHFAHEPQQSCKYCGFDSLCGRRWEVLQ